MEANASEGLSLLSLSLVIITFIPSLISAGNLAFWVWLWTKLSPEMKEGSRGTFVQYSAMANLFITYTDHTAMIVFIIGDIYQRPLVGFIGMIGVIISFFPIIYSSMTWRDIHKRVTSHATSIVVWDYRGNGGQDIKSSMSIGSWKLNYFSGADAIPTTISAINTQKPSLLAIYDNGSLGVKSIKEMINTSKGALRAAVVISDKDSPYQATLLSYGLRSVIVIDRNFEGKYDIMDIVQSVFQSLAVGADMGAAVAAASINKPESLITLKGDSTWKLIQLPQN